MEKEKIKDLVAQMTLEEKASFCVGKDFWHLQGLERLGIPQTMVTDGPHGLRKQVLAADHLGLSESNTAICFPAGCALASGFDPALAETMGSELGKLAQAEEVSVILGPAMNIKRSPLCGRNFEYYSEDPLVSSRIAAGTVKGVQGEGIGTSPKHFLANNQEYYRMTSNSVVDERTMREIYLASFEEMVKDAKPWTMMCSYNRINGTYACENQTYLTDILRDEWGFDGYVMTDWGACDDPVLSIKAGLDLEMPGPGTDNVRRIIAAVKDGKLEEEVLTRAVERILNIVMRYTEGHRESVYDFEAGHETAKRIAEECAVLLKNEDKVLPLKEEEKVLIVGPYAETPRYQGGGSSHINPYQVTGAWDTLKENVNVAYAEGYSEEDSEKNRRLFDEVLTAAKEVKKVVIFAGLPDSYESEGYDRKYMRLPQVQNDLIKTVCAVNENTIVVLHNGSPVEMPWIAEVKAVLEVYLGGEAVGAATADLLYGKANPSGRLAETFPLRLEDTPTYPYYGVEKENVPYREGVMVGYRYYETMKKEVLFPFGHGLSYTDFVYSDLELDKAKMADTDVLQVSVKVKNTGDIAGKEVVQLYVASCTEDVVRPLRELRGFEKVTLAPGEEKRVTFALDKRAFAYWDIEQHDWYAPTGEYQIQIGISAAEIVLEKTVKVNSTTVLKPHFDMNTALGDMMKHPVAMGVLQQAMGAMMAGANVSDSGEESVLSKEAMAATAAAMPLRSLLSFSPEAKAEQLEQLVAAINMAIEQS